MNIRLALIILSASVILLISSCGNDSGIKRHDLIPANDLVPLLTDIYIGNGLLQYPGVRDRFNNKDTISSYIDIIKKHGYTKDRLDKTLQYYFVNDPKKLQKIYDEALAKLSEIQLRAETDKPVTKTNNLWETKNSLVVPEEGANNPGYFNIQISDTGLYSLSFTAVVYKNDQSLNPRLTVFFWKADSTGKQVRKDWNKVSYVKDDLKHIYLVTGRISDTTFRNISGSLLDCDRQNTKWAKHAAINDIVLKKGLVE